MEQEGIFPEDFLKCASFHGHMCPGLAIGYGAVKAAESLLGLGASVDEELVAVVENDSCAVDAIQVLLACTFGKGNLVFRDWGKQVFTFIDRKSGRAVRVSFTGKIPHHEERRSLKEKIDAGQATESDKARFRELRQQAIHDLTSGDFHDCFDVREITVEMPSMASVVTSEACSQCGEPTMATRLMDRDGSLVCRECGTTAFVGQAF
jgi:formylmethanofuran dehydrogenase subunit E